MQLSSADHARVSAAIAAAEARTSGEIVAIVSRVRPTYPETAFAGAVLAAFVLPLLAVLLGFEPARLIPFDGGWAGDAPEPLRAIEAFAAMQVAVFLLALALLRYTPLGLWMTPRGVRRDHVHREAMAQFLAQGMHVTEARTGVLLYVSLPDHVAEVVADAGIYAKVAPETWGETVAAITEGARSGDLAGGFERAVTLAGDVLAEHFPPASGNPNELPDRLIEV